MLLVLVFSVYIGYRILTYSGGDPFPRRLIKKKYLHMTI
jgi:hypothetical protein